jgi:CCR4-NOT transcription complex subunit 10
VALGLGDPVSAFTLSQQLLATPQLPGCLQYLGKLYSAEALVLLENVTDAMKILDPDSIGDLSVIGEHYLECNNTSLYSPLI